MPRRQVVVMKPFRKSMAAPPLPRPKMVPVTVAPGLVALEAELQLCKQQNAELQEKLANVPPPIDITGFLAREEELKQKVIELETELANVPPPIDITGFLAREEELKQKVTELETELDNVPPPIDITGFLTREQELLQEIQKLQELPVKAKKTSTRRKLA